MRERFTRLTSESLDDDPRLAVVLADIGVDRFEESGALARHRARVINVGIREQLMVGVAAGLAQEGMRPDRPQLRAVPRRAALRADQARPRASGRRRGAGQHRRLFRRLDQEGRTHQAPGDVALLATVPGFAIHVPGHPDEAEELLRREYARDGRAYVRLSADTNAEPRPVEELTVVREGPAGAPLILAVGPALDPVLEAAADLAVTVAYASTVLPFPGGALRELATGSDIVIVEPYLAGTSAAALADALRDQPRRLLALGVPPLELRRYGTPDEHRRAYGLDADGIRRSLDAFLAA